MKQGRITMSGRNGGYDTRTVFMDGLEIGQVICRNPGHPGSLWKAVDCEGRVHEDTWITDWHAAEALSRAVAITQETKQ